MNKQLEEQMVETYMPLVGEIVRKMKKNMPNSVETDELKSLGMMGLLDAVRRFTPNQGAKFETYATKRIRGQILDGLRTSDSLTRTMRKKEKEMKKSYEVLEQKLSRPPTEKEMAEFLNLSVKDYRTIMMQISLEKVDSLDETYNQEDEVMTKLAILEDQDLKLQVDILEEKERKEMLIKLIDGLSDNEKKVLALIYYENLTLSEIGRIMDLHKSRISQIHSQAIKRLKMVLGNKKEEIF